MTQLLRATPESCGIPSEAIARFIDTVQEKGLEIHSFMLQRDGAIVAEAWWKPYAADVPHQLASLSKSFTSTAVGFAVQDELLTVEDHVLKFFPDFKDACENLKKMKVKHLLSMNTGHIEDTIFKMFQSDEWTEAFLKLDVPKEPGTHFLYNNGATYMLSAIVQKLVGKNINDYLDEKLYRKIGIQYPKWKKSPNGISMGEAGLNITTEDIMRFTMFVQNKGAWNGVRLLSEQWIDTATSVHSDSAPNVWEDWAQGYGYQFWRCRHGAYMANGAYGQFGIVLNDKNATIAITSGMDECQQLLDCVWDILLPAMGDEALPENVEAHNKLLAKMGNLELPIEHNEITDTIQGQMNGNTYLLEDNVMGITHVRLSFTDSGAKAMMEVDGLRAEADVGHGERVCGKMPMRMNEALLADASLYGTWVGRYEYRLVVTYRETPITIEFVHKFDGDELILTMNFNVSMNGCKTFELRGKVDK